jgi:protein-S-isoprenylcysteine O-methyltransferase Ste14
VSWLELRVPPDVVWLVLAGLTWLVSALTPSLDVGLALRVPIAVVVLATAVALVATARAALAAAGTTFTPTAPDRSSHLVTSGVYRFTRNPMYLGMLLALLAIAAVLANPFCLVLSALFVAYMNRLQITPEERILGARFGPAYEAYASRVRRWL